MSSLQIFVQTPIVLCEDCLDGSGLATDVDVEHLPRPGGTTATQCRRTNTNRLPTWDTREPGCHVSSNQYQSRRIIATEPRS